LLTFAAIKTARPAKPSEQEQKGNIQMNDLSNETGNAGCTCMENPPKRRKQPERYAKCPF
jgi:hypothetical protein